MTVNIGATEFAKGTSRDEPCWVQGLDSARVVEQQALTRSDEVGTYNRKNVSTVLTLQVKRHHASVGAAADFVLSHPEAAYALAGDVSIVSPSANAWTLGQGSIERVSLLSWTGRCTVHTYTLRGGALTAVPPA